MSSRPKLDTAIACLDTATGMPEPAIPGVIAIAVDNNGKTILSHASGFTSLGGDTPMTLDTVLWLASCTKLLTGIACMQLVESGKLSLDSADELDHFAPELKDLKVLTRDIDGRLTLVQQERAITLRMLMTHTAGFGYAFDSPDLCEWARPIGIDDFSGRKSDVLYRPLTLQPGTAFQYGVSMDWVGVVIERVSNMSLEEYFRKFIFEPLNVTEIAFFPMDEMKSRLAYLHRRKSDGSLTVSDHLLRHSLVPASDLGFCMGGCGCFGTLKDYSRIMAVLLNNGTCTQTKQQILKPETVEQMFTDQIPSHPIYHNTPCQSAKPELANNCPITPKAGNPSDGWGLSFALSHQDDPETGRAAGSASWEGLANLFWFADRTNGVAMIVGTQILPYGDFEVLQLCQKIEKEIYMGRKSGC